MLEDVYKSYRDAADVINWKLYNKNELFYEYIKHENGPYKDNYYAGIVCRFWGYGAKVYNLCNKHVTYEQCYDVLIDTINYVLKKRVWENKESSLYGDPLAADKAFHMVLKRERALLLSNLTAYKRLTNFNPISIDELHEEFNDASEGLFDISDETMTGTLNDIHMIDLIKHKEPLQVLYLDTVCFNDWNSLKSVIRILKLLSIDDYSYYHKLYGISLQLYKRALIDINKCSYETLLIGLRNTLQQVRKENYD